MKPFEPRDGMRGAQFVRQWRVLIALRRQRWTLEQLARELQCSQRTIARDIEVLEAVGLPITTVVERRRGITGEFFFAGDWPAWPRNEVAPVAELSSSALVGGTLRKGSPANGSRGGGTRLTSDAAPCERRFS